MIHRLLSTLQVAARRGLIAMAAVVMTLTPTLALASAGCDVANLGAFDQTATYNAGAINSYSGRYLNGTNSVNGVLTPAWTGPIDTRWYNGGARYAFTPGDTLNVSVTINTTQGTLRGALYRAPNSATIGQSANYREVTDTFSYVVTSTEYAFDTRLQQPSAATGTISIAVACSAAPVAAPTISSLSPASGPTGGGTALTINGSNLTDATVTIDGASVTPTAASDSAITVTTPAHAAGVVAVAVTTGGGTASSNFTYLAAPTVTSISPTAGPTTGGTTVIITGGNLSGATAVTFGATAATGFVVNSASQITATAPANTPGTYDVRVTTAGGTSATSAADQYTYIAAPTVTSITPTTGPQGGGTSVVITGTNLSGATAVSFGATAATGFVVNSGTQITATAPAGTGTVDVRVTTTGGTSATSAADQFTYVPAPSVTSITPTSGPGGGGASVVITGVNFSGTTAVTFGGTAANGYVVNSGTQITATAPAGTGVVDVRVTTAGGTSATSAADQFTYIAGPSVTSISPTAGPTTGGTTVVITGANLSGATAVTFGATAATGFVVDSATQITATSPANAAGTYDVRVTSPGGTSPTSAADQFTYVAAPSVTSITPTSGPTGGGASVVITGVNFSGTTAVTFGATAATGFTVNSGTQITATAPANAAGTYDVRVTTVGGTSATSAADQYTYVAAPSVTSISPTAGPASGGTTVTITGVNFSGATAVTFGGAAATGFTVNSGTQITATAPAGSNTVDIQVTTAGGTSATSAADQFTYIAAPTISTVSPNAGPTGGGASVVILGTDFSGATAVTFGGVAATGFVINSSTQITATSPAHAAGTVDIRVTTQGGTSATSAADQFTYAATPTVTSISPTAGPTSGGASVVITGTDFTSVTAVTFGAMAATGYTVNSSTQITATAPAGAAGTVDVTVSTAGGTSATSAADQYTYVAAPSVTSITPTTGPNGGGTTVIVTGSGFSGATVVTFGGSGGSFVVNSDTQITATSPAGSGTVDVRVTSAGGTSATSAADQFTYVAAPSVTSISPTAGPTSGGTTVIVTGSGFTGATAVTFGATVGSFVVNSDTQITATSPAGSGTVDIRVTTVGGTSAASAADQFTYVAAPSVTSISPTAGPTSGGTTVIITGADLSGATAVTFGATAATGFVVDSATQITATAPAGAGVVDVRVTTVGGTSATSAADQFTYVVGPGVGSVSPNAGPVAGGTSVIITGSGFTGATAVVFGSTAATGFVVNSDTQITATSPAGTGVVDIRVTTVGGTTPTGAGDLFTYAPVPTVSGVSANAGPSTGGASVVITGSGFTSATSVTFDGVAATGFVVDSATQITATTPAHAPGPVSVTVATAGGTGTLVGGYTFVASPAVTSLSPNAGPVAGGTTLILTGSNFTGATAVTFGGVSATGFVVDSATQITATAPAHAAGAVTVAVTTSGGVSVAGAGNSFTYAAVPTVSTLSPASGLVAGGTSVQIDGAGLTGASVVKFGSVDATSFTVDSDTRITAVSPAGAVGPVNLTVTTPGGTSAAVVYEYVEPAALQVSVTARGGEVGASYDGRVLATGGAAPYAYAVTAGALPPGIVLGADGVLSGTPTTAGDYNATVTATDAGGVTGSASVAVSIRPSVLTLTSAVPSGVDGVAYSGGFTASGGVAPYRFSLTGALPPGLAFDAATGALSGAPAGQGSYAFTVTVTDSTPGQPLTASQSVSITVGAAVPPVVEPVVVPRGGVDQPVTIDLSDKIDGDYTDVIITRPPEFGRVTVQVNGGASAASTGAAMARMGAAAAPAATTFVLIYTPNPGYDGPDTFTYAAVGPGGQSPPARIVIGSLPAPVAVVDEATVVGAKPVIIDLTANDQGAIDSLAIVDAPANGLVTVDGLKVTYISNAGFSGLDTFTYTVTGPGGVSAKAEARVTVTPQVSAAPPISVTVMAGQAAVIDLTNGATGGPFTGATVVSVTPSDAGPATIGSPSAGRYVLTFTPAATFSGVAVIKYTIANGAAVSAPGQVTVTVTPRPDPTMDAEVRGLVAAQGATARRFATAQIANFNRRLEQLHSGGGAGRAFGMTLQGGVTARMDGVEAREAMRKRSAFEAPNDVGTLRSAEARAAAVTAGPDDRGEEGGEGGQPKRWGFWAAGAADVGLREAFTGQKGFRFTTDGLTLGADYRVNPRLAIGGGVGYGHDTTKVGHEGTRSEADSVSAAAYASFLPMEHGFIDGVIGYGKLGFDTRRHVTATGDRVTGQRDGRQLFASLTAGVEHRRGDLLVSPYGRVGMSRSTLDAYDETGGGLWALSYQRQRIDSLTGALGLRAAYRYPVSMGELSPRLRVEYTHDFEGAESAGVQYADWRNGPVYRLVVDGVDRDLARIELGVDLRLRSGWRLGMDFDNSLGSNSQSHGVRLSVESAF